MKKKAKKIALILSGCGHMDGSEITESVSLLISLHMYGAETKCFAPNIEFNVKNHLTREKTSETRNVLQEAARIARGHIQDIKELKADDFDGLAFSGGFGAVTNLSTWSSQGARCQVNPEVARVIKEFHSQSKPIGAACIAPTLLAKVLGPEKIELTIGDDLETSQEINKTGAHHVTCPVDDYVTDRLGKVITTPAYMYDAQPHEVFKGINGLAKELVEMA
jgi:enhancing lycopene biosynthesis protein 2